MAGAGKRQQLQAALAKVAASRGIPFSVCTKPLTPATDESGGATTAEDDDAGEAATDAGPFLIETSLVHIGLDVAMMSMKDKHILRPVLVNLGRGSHVLAGEAGHASRILVLYHAHLLSSESVLLLQACLEQNEGDLSVWMTSELPVPQRIRDWFVELAVAGPDHSFQAFHRSLGSSTQPVDWPDIFRAIVDKWLTSPAPKLQAVKEVKFFLYEMLMRNLRWVEATHFLLDTILSHERLTEGQRIAAVKAIAACEATAGGYTIPSYRIPILWESLFLQLRTLLAPQRQANPQIQTDGAPAARATGTRKPRGRRVQEATREVA
jgi:hypothetical protein